MSVGQTLEPSVAAAETPAGNELLQRLKSVAMTQKGQMLIAGFVLLTVAAWPFSSKIIESWFAAESYYQHGPLIPLAILYIFALRLPEWRKEGVRPTWIPLVFLPIPLYLIFGVAKQEFYLGVGVFYLTALFLMAWSFLGGRWAVKMIPYLGFFALCLPMWTRIIETTTSPLQIYSTKIAYYFLKVVGMWPSLESPTLIILPRWQLNVEVACSGMKMTLAMLAMAVFIMLAARLSWWKNLIVLTVAMPLAVFMNGIRIGIIGVVGNEYGEDNGMLMHDYGSYAVMGFAFYLMYVLAKKLGWKI